MPPSMNKVAPVNGPGRILPKLGHGERILARLSRDRAPAGACREAAGAADKSPASDGGISVISPEMPTLSQIVQVVGEE